MNYFNFTLVKREKGCITLATAPAQISAPGQLVISLPHAKKPTYAILMRYIQYIVLFVICDGLATQK